MFHSSYITTEYTVLLNILLLSFTVTEKPTIYKDTNMNMNINLSFSSKLNCYPGLLLIKLPTNQLQEFNSIVVKW